MWQFQLTGLDMKPVGEITNAAGRKLTIALNKLDQCSFSVRMDNMLADQMAACEGWIKVWRKGALVFHGPIITAEETGDSSGTRLAVTCQSGGWAMLNKAFANAFTLAPNSGLRTATDRAVIVKNEMATAQGWNLDYGIDLTSYPISAAETVTYVIDPFMPMADLLRVMQSSDNGFDWRMVPLDPWDEATGTLLNYKHTAFWAAPVLGTQQDEAIWEFGPGTLANIESYRTMVSREQQITWAVSVPNPTTYFNTSDGSIYPTKWGTMVDVVTRDEFPDLHVGGGSPAMQSLREAHISARKNPRRTTIWVPQMDPTGRSRVPDYGIDYEVGDTVHGRGIANNEIRFDGLFRCWGVDFEILDNGFEKAALVLEEEQ